MARKFITLDLQDGIIANGPTKQVRVNTDYIVEYRAGSDAREKDYTMVTIQYGERVSTVKVLMPVTKLDALVSL